MLFLAGITPTVMESVGVAVAPSRTQERRFVPTTDTEPPGSLPQSNPQNPSAKPDSPKSPSNDASTAINQNNVFWEAYNKAGDDEDKEFVKTSGSDLDTLLIFAGLFSAINTAFIVDSYKNLKPDPAEETNKLLRSVFRATIDPLNAILDETPFAASPRDVRINALFFASLCCSLSAAFGAVLAKQWLTQYDRDGGGTLKSPAARGRERQRKSEGREKWHLEDVIVTLPTLLQFSLFFFFIGLVDLLWPLNNIVTSIILGFTIATFLFYITTIAIAVADKSAPFQTRLSLLLYSPVRRVLAFVEGLVDWRPIKINPKVESDVDISCFTYLFERMVEPEHVVVLAGAAVSLWDRLRGVAITVRFMDVHLKPTVGQIYSLPRLYGPHRPPLLKLLRVLVKDWRDQGIRTIQTPTYPSIDVTKFFDAIPIALQKAFMADPVDMESFQNIIDILFTLQDLGHSPTSSDDHGMGTIELWLHNDMIKALKNPDLVTQQNTLKLLLFIATSTSSDEQLTAGTIVRTASIKNPGLMKLMQLAVLKELWSALPVPGKPSGILGALPLFSWIVTGQMPDDMKELANMVEALPHGSKRVEAETHSFLSKVVEMLFISHLKPRLDGWWRLPGLRGQNKRSLLRITHTIIVKWGYLQWGLQTWAPSYQLLHPLFSSLRAELWETFLMVPRDSEDVQMIAEICRSLPTSEPLNDEITASVNRKLGVDTSTLFWNNRAEPMELENTLLMLCSNINLLISFINFRTICLDPKTSLVIPNHLCSSMWTGGKADLGDFKRATFCVQLLPAFFPEKLRTLRFPEYLHFCFKHYHEQGRWNEGQQSVMCWAYLLSLQRMLFTAEAPELAKELKEHDHQSHLLDIYYTNNYDKHGTCPLLALHLFLHLWSHDTSDMQEGHAEIIVRGLWVPKFSLTKITRDFGMYTQSCRVGDMSDEQWCEEISAQVKRDMGQMVKWLYSYLEAAVCGRLVKANLWYWRRLGEGLENYGHWCDELDRQMGTAEYGLLTGKLRDLMSHAGMVEEDDIRRNVTSSRVLPGAPELVRFLLMEDEAES